MYSKAKWRENMKEFNFLVKRDEKIKIPFAERFFVLLIYFIRCKKKKIKSLTHHTQRDLTINFGEHSFSQFQERERETERRERDREGGKLCAYFP